MKSFIKTNSAFLFVAFNSQAPHAVELSCDVKHWFSRCGGKGLSCHWVTDDKYWGKANILVVLVELMRSLGDTIEEHKEWKNVLTKKEAKKDRRLMSVLIFILFSALLMYLILELSVPLWLQSIFALISLMSLVLFFTQKRWIK